MPILTVVLCYLEPPEQDWVSADACSQSERTECMRPLPGQFCSHTGSQGRPRCPLAIMLIWWREGGR